MKQVARLFTSALSVSLVLIVLVGCSTATEKIGLVAQQKIHQQYSVHYDGDRDRTMATAEFRSGGATGTTLELDGESVVLNNSDRMHEREMNGTSYESESAGLVQNHEFVFVDNEGKKYTNTVSLTPIAFSNDTPEELSTSGEVLIKWEGQPIRDGETVGVTIVGENDRVMRFENTAGATSILIEKASFSGLKLGTYTIQLVRGSSQDLKEAAEPGGKAYLLYNTEKRSIELVE